MPTKCSGEVRHVACRVDELVEGATYPCWRRVFALVGSLKCKRETSNYTRQHRISAIPQLRATLTTQVMAKYVIT